jgi:hypothetical protein
MNPYQLIIGNWRIPSTMVPNTDEFMHIGADGRLVHFVHPDSTGTRVQAMTHWSEPLGENRFRVRGALQQAGWTVALIPTSSGMTIERNELKFYLRRAADEDLPEWYHSRLEQALSRMSKLEAKQNEAEQAAP